MFVVAIVGTPRKVNIEGEWLLRMTIIHHQSLFDSGVLKGVRTFVPSLAYGR